MEFYKDYCGLRRDFRDFAIFSYLLPVFTGIEPRTFRSKGQRVIHSAMSAERAQQKNFIIEFSLLKRDSALYTEFFSARATCPRGRMNSTSVSQSKSPRFETHRCQQEPEVNNSLHESICF